VSLLWLSERPYLVGSPCSYLATVASHGWQEGGSERRSKIATMLLNLLKGCGQAPSVLSQVGSAAMVEAW
jgi:hypothetical protein